MHKCNGDHLQYQQRREFSPAEIIFISNLKILGLPSVHHNELGLQLGQHLVVPLPGLLERDFWNFLVKSIWTFPSTHSQVTDEGSLCWRKTLFSAGSGDCLITILRKPEIYANICYSSISTNK